MEVQPLGAGIATIFFKSEEMWLRAVDWILYDGIGTLIPSLLICYCYYKVLKALNTTYRYTPIVSRSAMNSIRIYVYMCLPIVCFFPFIIIHFLEIFFEDFEVNPRLALGLGVVRRLWGFLNLFAFKIFRSETENESFAEESSQKL